jgi:7,8-dihydropterin-6-yl-methyl-4-(beta-D-ribofuranosyl)aminobenzene 5'-phosphate synthase
MTPLLLLLAAAPASVPLAVPEVDELEVVSVVDNFYDCFQKDEKCAVRHNLTRNQGFDAIRLQAEMGLAYLVRARVGVEWHTVLFDFGLSQSVYAHNLGKLKLEVDKAEALVLSHAHEDHYAGMEWASKKSSAPIYVGSAEAFLRRQFVTPQSSWDMGTLSRAALDPGGKRVVETPQPRVVAGSALLSGRIEQATPYEKVPPFLKVEVKGKLEQESMAHELAVAYRVKGKGLVVLTSCAHSGVINTVNHFKKVAKDERVLAVIGGFHLTSAPDEQVTKTVDALVALKPTFVAPMHCTGNRAVDLLVQKLPAAYVHPGVGTKYTFAAGP